MLFDEQERLNGIADRIVAAGGDGYAGLIVDPTNHDVRLYWRGQLPPAVAAAVDQGRLQAPVRVYDAPYTDAQLRAEAQRWLDSGLATDAYAKSDGTGVAVEVAGPPSAGPPALPGGSSTAFTVSYGHEAAVPLVGKPEPIGVTASPPWWRWNDTSPYWAARESVSSAAGVRPGSPWWTARDTRAR